MAWAAPWGPQAHCPGPQWGSLQLGMGPLSHSGSEEPESTGWGVWLWNSRFLPGWGSQFNGCWRWWPLGSFRRLSSEKMGADACGPPVCSVEGLERSKPQQSCSGEGRPALWAVCSPGVSFPRAGHSGPPGTALHPSPRLLTWVFFLGGWGVSRKHEASLS